MTTAIPGRSIAVAVAGCLLLAAFAAATPARAHPSKDDRDHPARQGERSILPPAAGDLAGAAPRAADPSQGRVSLEDRTEAWAGQHYPAGSTAFAGTTCRVPSDLVCDHFGLTVDVDPTHWETNTGGVEFTISWPDPANDFDLHVFDRDTGKNVGSSIEINPSTGVAEERVFVPNAAGDYDVRVNPYQVVDSAYEGQVVLESREGLDPRAVPTERLADVPCVDGFAGPFECDGIDLLGFVPAGEFDSAGISDIWGWTDPDNGDEYVIMGKTNGTAFFRVTDPTAPEYLGELPNAALLQEVWHDVKVFEDHAFIVSESEPHGMTVFDLTRLRGVEQAQEWDADAFYPLNVAAHNIAINEDTGFAYILGGNAGIVAPDQCLSGLHMVDINEPKTPIFAGCYLEEGGPGTAARIVGGGAEDLSPAAYVHDTQCVIYRGPDTDHRGREICFNAAETQIVIADVTDKLLPETLGTLSYDDVGYAHQGWLTEDHRFLITNDELDELNAMRAGEPGMNTRTVVVDVTDLDAPKVHFEHFHDTISPDHNNYVHEGLVYQSNYSSGLRVLDAAFIEDADDPRLEPAAFFDTFPAHSEVTFDGTWSNYPYFDSGTIAVSGRAEGLFLLRLQEDDPGLLGVEIDRAERPVVVPAGDRGTADVTIRNVGDADDSYQLEVTDLPDGWTATVAPDEVAVAAGSDAPATVTIDVPAGTEPGRSSVTVTATSTTDPDVSASAPVAVVVRRTGTSVAGTAGGPSAGRTPEAAAGSPAGGTTRAGGAVVSASLAAHAGDPSPDHGPVLLASLLLAGAVTTAGRRRRGRHGPS
ncbi:MAG: choice-of-anchor B family protein [Actinobacteria bacterium]|nr:choice-of-anchor B family protein [Actinomycetota bacterium]